MCQFVKKISSEYSEFKADEEKLLLFGGLLEAEDLKVAQPSMRVVPVTREEF